MSAIDGLLETGHLVQFSGPTETLRLMNTRPDIAVELARGSR